MNIGFGISEMRAFFGGQVGAAMKLRDLLRKDLQLWRESYHLRVVSSPWKDSYCKLVSPESLVDLGVCDDFGVVSLELSLVDLSLVVESRLDCFLGDLQAVWVFLYAQAARPR